MPETVLPRDRSIQARINDAQDPWLILSAGPLVPPAHSSNSNFSIYFKLSRMYTKRELLMQYQVTAVK